jgi:AcrR family transcriptional regulator
MKQPTQDLAKRFDPRRLPRQHRAKETFEKILEVTADLLVERGFEGVNTNIIAERAHVKPPAVYRYFPNKFALYYALAEKIQGELEVALDLALLDAETASLDELVDKLIDLTGKFWIDRPAFGLLWFGEWASQGEPMPRLAFGVRTVSKLRAATSRFRHLGPEREALVLTTAMNIAIAVVHMGLEVPDHRPAVLVQAKIAVNAYLSTFLS